MLLEEFALEHSWVHNLAPRGRYSCTGIAEILVLFAGMTRQRTSFGNCHK